MASGGTSSSINAWFWVLAALLIAATCYGLGRTLFGRRPSLAAATTVAVALSVATALALELLRYRYDKALGFALSVFTPVAGVGTHMPGRREIADFFRHFLYDRSACYSSNFYGVFFNRT